MNSNLRRLGVGRFKLVIGVNFRVELDRLNWRPVRRNASDRSPPSVTPCGCNVRVSVSGLY
jgi:hypothetical protein